MQSKNRVVSCKAIVIHRIKCTLFMVKDIAQCDYEGHVLVFVRQIFALCLCRR
jgi:hypothetical protein